MIMAESFLSFIHTIFKSSQALLRQIMRCIDQTMTTARDKKAKFLITIIFFLTNCNNDESTIFST